jgi:hypothetical protein
MSGRRKLLIVGVVAGVIALREEGVWSAQFACTRSTTTTTTTASTTTGLLKRGLADGRPFEWPTRPSDAGLDNANDGDVEEVILAEVRRQLDATPLAEGRVTALRIDAVTTTGCRWLPLYKPMGGTLEASMRIDRTQDGEFVTRNLTSKIDVDMSVVGLCSARDARVEFAKVVSSAFVHAAAEP